MIYQGSNSPIIIQLNKDVSNATAIEVDLSVKSKTLKHWSLADIQVDAQVLTCPLAEEETLQFDVGRALIEVKYRINTTNWIVESVYEAIVSRQDKTSLGGGTADSSEQSSIETMKVLTSAVLLPSYSPYIGENNHWFQYDLDTDSFIDTGVAADGEVTPENVDPLIEDYLEKHPFIETDPTVPTWAKQPVKPTYTASEVGAYTKPVTGIPESDLAEAVKNKLNADVVLPNKLKFTGAVETEFDGSKAIAVEIPEDCGTDIDGLNTEVESLKQTKVDKVAGKGLSTNDYIDADKAKVDAIPENPKYTDTVYDDTSIKNAQEQLREDLSQLSGRVQTVETALIGVDALADDIAEVVGV